MGGVWGVGGGVGDGGRGGDPRRISLFRNAFRMMPRGVSAFGDDVEIFFCYGTSSDI